MNKRLLHALCVLPVGLLAGCASPPQSSPMKSARGADDFTAVEFTAKQRQTIASLFSTYRSILFTKKQSCTSDCTVTIKMQVAEITLENGEKKKFCVGTLPEEIEFPDSDSLKSDKTITWKLDVSSTTIPAGNDIQFHYDYGILKIGEIQGRDQFKPAKNRVDKVTFTGINKHKRPTEATYVPVIIRLINGVPETCGTADPKIINT